jgi:hypothetical protein
LVHLLGAAAVVLLAGSGSRAGASNVFYISPTGSGTLSGKSIKDAAPAAELPDLVADAEAGDTIYLLADAGDYVVRKSLRIKSGGEAGAPILIKGINSEGRAATARFVGNRAPNWRPGAPKGREVFRLGKGANHLAFENIGCANVNNCFRITEDVADIRIEGVTADNVHYLLDDLATKGARRASIHGLVLRDARVDGFAKGVARLQYDSSGILIEDVYADSRQIDGANFAIGIHLLGTVHDVVVRNVTIGNILDTTNRYWNGDGFATERGVYNVLFKNTSAFNNSDAGYDLKSRSTKLVGTLAEGNTRNYRFWADDTLAENLSGTNPEYHGGSNTVANVWIQSGASVVIRKPTFIHEDPEELLFDLRGTARLKLFGLETAQGASSPTSAGQQFHLRGSPSGTPFALYDVLREGDDFHIIEHWTGTWKPGRYVPAVDTFGLVTGDAVSVAGNFNMDRLGFTADPIGGHYSISESQVPEVPEPSTWLMLLAGFGAIGATLRQRRRCRPARSML